MPPPPSLQWVVKGLSGLRGKRRDIWCRKPKWGPCYLCGYSRRRGLWATACIQTWKGPDTRESRPAPTPSAFLEQRTSASQNILREPLPTWEPVTPPFVECLSHARFCGESSFNHHRNHIRKMRQREVKGSEPRLPGRSLSFPVAPTRAGCSPWHPPSPAGLGV